MKLLGIIGAAQLFLLVPLLGESEPISVQFVSSAMLDTIEVRLEHPRMLIGSGSGSAPNIDNVTMYDVAFLGLGISLCRNTVYLNSQKYQMPEQTKIIWISDDCKKVTADGKIIKSQDLDRSDLGLIINPDESDSIKLDNGFTVQIKGLLASGGSGIVFDDDHCIRSVGLMVFKIWGTEVFLWDKKVGDLKNAGENKVLVIDGLNGIYPFK